MKKKRTKEQKIKAQAQRAPLPAQAQAPQTSVQTGYVFKHTDTKAPKVEVVEGSVSIEYIKKDLLKTFVVTIVLFGILVGIYFYLRYN